MERPSLYNLEAEQSVLGSMLIERKACEIATEIVTPDDFGMPFHRRIFAAMQRLLDRDDPIDNVALADQINRTGGFGEGESPTYFFQLTNAVPSAAAVGHYANIVSGFAVRRRILDAANKQISLVYDLDREISGVTAECGKVLESAASRATRHTIRTMREIVAEVVEELEAAHESQGKLNGVPTGLYDLDRATNGWQKGDLVLIGARPGVGKTAVSVNTFAGTAVMTGRRVAMFSLEMADAQIVRRMIAANARVNMGHMKRGLLDGDDWRRVGEVCSGLSEVSLLIDDSPDITPSGMRMKLRQIQRIHGPVDLVVVDYLALMTADNTKERDWRGVDECAKAMKRIAKEFKVPVVLLTQLNKDIDKRGEGRPVLADIKEAGEAHADIVAFLWPERNQTADAEVKKIWLSVAKHRNGPLGDIPLAYHAAWTRFDQMADGNDDPTPPATTTHAAVTKTSTETTHPFAYKDSGADFAGTNGSGIDIDAWAANH